MVVGITAGPKRPAARLGGAAASPSLAAAGLLIAAARKDGTLTEVERQSVTAALMKLLHVPGPKAASLRAEAERAEADEASLARTAAALDPDDREQLVAALWALSRGAPDDAPTTLMDSVGEAFGLSPERVAALRPRPA